MKKNKRVPIFEEYKKCFSFIKESKKFIYFITAIFFIFVLIGFFVTPPESVSSLLFDYIKGILETTKGFDFQQMFGFIFSNNLQSSFLGLFFGIFLGIFPLFSSIGNGYVVGFVLSKSVLEEGLSVVFNLFPHGIFELPAVFISLGMGLKLGFTFFQNNWKKKILKNLLNSLRVFVLIVFPLLIIAAIIESILIFAF